MAVGCALDMGWPGGGEFQPDADIERDLSTFFLDFCPGIIFHAIKNMHVENFYKKT